MVVDITTGDMLRYRKTVCGGKSTFADFPSLNFYLAPDIFDAVSKGVKFLRLYSSIPCTYLFLGIQIFQMIFTGEPAFGYFFASFVEGALVEFKHDFGLFSWESSNLLPTCLDRNFVH